MLRRHATIKFLMLWLGLATGNFLYCWLANRPYDVAIERSVFEAVALLGAWFVTPEKY
jgi:hypothetical protein